jgi:hypothetical protein
VPGRHSELKSIEVIAEDDVWAVGSDKRGLHVSSADMLLQHWDGSTWTRDPFYDQTLNGWVNELSEIDAVAPNDVWAVGTRYDGVNLSLPLILHWDGTAWTRLPDPAGLEDQAGLRAVEAISANDVWAVGWTGDDIEHMQVLILHWDGSKWSKVAVAAISGSEGRSALDDMAVIAPDDIWAIGFRSESSVFYERGHHLVLHWDGSAWNVMPITGLEPAENSSDRGVSLTAIAGTAPDDIWVVGYHNASAYDGSTNSWDPMPGLFTAHWDGSVWSVIPGPAIETTSSALFDVIALAPDDVWAVGATREHCCYHKALVMHWQGGSWSVVPSFSEGSGGQLFGIDALPGGELWAAGTFSADNRMQALVERYTAECPQPAPACTLEFSDVPPDNTFYPAVRCMACMAIANGYEGGTFRPGEIVTRGQMAKMVSNAAGFSDPIENNFGDYSVWADVPITHTFHIYTARLAIYGVAEGYQCGVDMPPERCEYNRRYFHPAEKVTRGQAAQFVSRAAFLDEPVPPGQQTFADVRPGQPFWSEIERVAEHGGIRGYQCGTRAAEPCDSQHRPYFRSTEYVSRGQAAKFLANIFHPDCPAQYTGQ